MPKLIILPAILLITAIFCSFIYRNRNNRYRIFIIAVPLLIIIAFLNVYESTRMPIMLKTSESYITDFSESKSAWDTSIRLKKIFMDLNSMNATYSVSGKEKVVAVELKRNPEDTKSIGHCTGLWIGGRILPENSFVGMSYSSDEFISPVYLVFYLSNGESIPFEIKDTTGIRDLVRIIHIDKTIDYNGSTLTLQKFNKGINYSSIDFKSNFSPDREIVEIKLSVNGYDMEEGSHGWSGGGNGYTGSFGFDPVNAENIKIKITNKSLNRTDIIDLSIK